MTAQVRFWDRNGQLVHSFDGDPTRPDEDNRIALTLPLDTPVGQWLVKAPHEELSRSMVTVDGGETRWSGLIQQFTVDKRGSCSECDHCQERVVTVSCYDPPQRVLLGASV